MTKQGEIRERVVEFCRVMRAEGELRRFTPQSDASDILEYLRDKGVVIKVDRELPEPADLYSGGDAETVTRRAQQQMLKAGYSATVPLIEGWDE